ncbi:Reverse transcriptase zinc-binding domain [Macleaya cordata]|uniref:Reverse transcriptase zinc-binding domain n=1 Tax=Macleaya cordata TaxID=56857 RepID=A0A200PPU6_MACCD|nr:Reverse transcriptase zinc-binding domain [Macleaya cordata]
MKEAVEEEFNIPGLIDLPITHVQILYESRLQAESNVCLWALTPTGTFTVKLAFEQIWELAPACPFAHFYWANYIPKKLSVFFWRSLKNTIPVDVRIQSYAINLASACVCYVQHRIESFNHLFVQSSITASLWDHFAPPFGIHREDFYDFRDLIWAWFNVVPVGSQMGCLAVFIPMVIMWEIWLERNRRIHNESPASLTSIRFKVVKWIQDINPRLKVKQSSPVIIKNFLASFHISLIHVRRKPITVLRWSTPPPGYFIINTDCASISMTAACGGVVRDNQGQIVVAFHSFYSSGTNNQVESRALMDGLALCQQIGIRRIAVRVDSSLVAGWFHAKGEIPWSLLRWWQRIRELAQDLDLFVAHVYRELNARPDRFMASMGISS